jgi:hypothetical protein
VESNLLPKQFCNIYVEMSDLQKRWYNKVLAAKMNSSKNDLLSMAQLNFMLMQLYKGGYRVKLPAVA